MILLKHRETTHSLRFKYVEWRRFSRKMFAVKSVLNIYKKLPRRKQNYTMQIILPDQYQAGF